MPPIPLSTELIKVAQIISLHKQFDFLNKYFRNNNNYPLDLIFKLIKRFLQNIYQPKLPTHTVLKKDLYFSFPFVGHTSVALKKELESSLNHSFPHIRFNIILTTSSKIGSFFKYKDRFPALFESRVVYKYTCPRCERGSYIAVSTRLLRSRACAHMGISHRTLCPLSTKESSPIRTHSEACSSSLKFEQFELLSSAPDTQSLLILESLYINKYKPPLDSNETATQLFTV